MASFKDRFNKIAEPYRTAMDQKAKDIFDELVKRLRLESIVPKSKEILADTDVFVIDQFKGKKGSAMLAHFVKPELDFINKQIEELSAMQFLTHQENVLFSRGTENMLALLTEYSNVRTEKVVIAAIPSSRVSGGPVGGKSQAFINESHLTGPDSAYDDDRHVTIAFMMDNRLIGLSFGEKVKTA